MPRLRLFSAVLLSAALVSGGCARGGDNASDEANQEATGADSLSAGTDVPSTLPPAGTVNPAASSGPGTYPDSANPAAVGQSQGASPASPNPADAVRSGAASDSAR